jgi:hypothetical protein
MSNLPLDDLSRDLTVVRSDENLSHLGVAGNGDSPLSTS